VLTERSTSQQQEMLTVKNELGNQINYWIYNDVDGGIDIYKKLKNSQKHIQHLQLPLQRLWRKKVKFVAPITEKQRDYYPILLKKSQAFLGIRITENHYKG